MIKYKNLSGKSNVDSYEYTDDSFTVLFKTGKHYIYSTAKNSLVEITKMQNLADVGTGLGSMLATMPHHPHDRNW